MSPLLYFSKRQANKSPYLFACNHLTKICGYVVQNLDAEPVESLNGPAGGDIHAVNPRDIHQALPSERSGSVAEAQVAPPRDR